MTDSTLPSQVGDQTAIKDAAQSGDASVVGSAKGKGKAVQEPEEDEEDDDDDDDDEEDEDDDDDMDEDEDLSIEPDEIDPTNISSYGIGNRPSRSRKPIDYSSEEAFQKAGLAPEETAGDEDDDKEFKAVSKASVCATDLGLSSSRSLRPASMGGPFADELSASQAGRSGPVSTLDEHRSSTLPPSHIPPRSNPTPRAKKTTTSEGVDAKTSQALEALSRADAAQLSTLILQQPSLPRLIALALRCLVQASPASTLEARAAKTSPNFIAFENILLVLEHASLSPDSSLPRRLLRSSNAILDFTFLAANVPDCRLRAKRLLWTIVDPVNADEFIYAATQSVVRSVERAHLHEIRPAVRVLGALLALLPFPRQGGKGAGAVNPARLASIDEVARVLSAKYADLVPSGCGTQDVPMDALAAKIDIIDAVSALVSRRLAQGLDVSSIIVRLEDKAAQGSTGPLLSLSLLADVLLARPVLLERIKGSLKSGMPANVNEREERQQAQKVLLAAETAVLSCTSASPGRTGGVASLGGGWQALLSQLKQGASQQRPEVGTKGKGKGKGRAISPDDEDHVIPASLLATLEAILPDLAADQARLKRILRRPAFRNRNEEEVVQLLFEDQAEASASSQDEADEAIAATPRIADVLPAVHRRANIFDDQPLDASRLRWHANVGADDAAEGTMSQPLPSSLKASILARVQMQNAAEIEAARGGEGQEWNPFAAEEAALLGSSREVGFEEDLELESEQDRINRKVAVSNLGGERGNAREWIPRRAVHGDSESEEDDENDGNEDTDLELRTDFKVGCTSYLAFYQRNQRNGKNSAASGESILGPGSYAHGWSWKEIATLPTLSHLARTFVLSGTGSKNASAETSGTESDALLSHAALDEPGDPASAPAGAPRSLGSPLTVTQSIFYSSTWHVPVLWLDAYRNADGSPLGLEELMQSGLFHRMLPTAQLDDATSESGKSVFATTLAPLLTPSGGAEKAEDTPAYFPPLSTADHPLTSLPSMCLHPCQTAAVVGEMVQGGDGKASQRSYLEAFMSVCASAVEMRAGDASFDGFAQIKGANDGQASRRKVASDESTAAPAQTPASSAKPSASVLAERAAERILILAYARHGAALFASPPSSKDKNKTKTQSEAGEGTTSTANVRKSAARQALKRELAGVGRQGKEWDDHLIESWGRAFEKNPRKDALVSSATAVTTDIIRITSGAGNPNLRHLQARGAGAGSESSDAGTGTDTDSDARGSSGGARFGPDRGRGGRVLRGGRGGAGGGGDGAGRGGGGTRGGHSGSDRQAKRKERRGNDARVRGADRKARQMGGAGAGLG